MAVRQDGKCLWIDFMICHLNCRCIECTLLSFSLSQEITGKQRQKHVFGSLLFKFSWFSMNSPSRPGIHSQPRINERRRYGKGKRYVLITLFLLTPFTNAWNVAKGLSNPFGSLCYAPCLFLHMVLLTSPVIYGHWALLLFCFQYLCNIFVWLCIVI